MRQIMDKCVLLLGLILMFNGFAMSQASFDVVSVKPVSTKIREAMDFRLEPKTLTVTSWSLALLIQRAYGVRRDQILGGPTWIDSEMYDIVAKTEEETGPSQMMLMLRTLLADRFGLRMRRETREGTVYALITGKTGPRLREAKEGTRSFVRLGHSVSGAYVIQGQNASVSGLIEKLANVLERPVIDRTGLKGSYDFRLEFAVNSMMPDSGESVFSVVQYELGLKLETQKGPVEAIVVESATKPSAN